MRSVSCVIIRRIIFFPQQKKLSSPLSLSPTYYISFFLLSFDFVFFFVIKHIQKNRFAFKKTNRNTHTYTPLYLYTSFFCDKFYEKNKQKHTHTYTPLYLYTSFF